MSHFDHEAWLASQPHKNAYLQTFMGADDQQLTSGVLFREIYVVGVGMDRRPFGDGRTFWGDIFKGSKKQRYMPRLYLFPCYVGQESMMVNGEPDEFYDWTQAQFWDHYHALMDIFQKRWVLMIATGVAQSETEHKADRMYRFLHNAAGMPIDGMFVELESADVQHNHDLGRDEIVLDLVATYPITPLTGGPAAAFASYPQKYRRPDLM
jgi:hypothetical protein